MANFGVDPESASHAQLAQVGGGMKVKVVLAAAMCISSDVFAFVNPPGQHLQGEDEQVAVACLMTKQFTHP